MTLSKLGRRALPLLLVVREMFERRHVALVLRRPVGRLRRPQRVRSSCMHQKTKGGEERGKVGAGSVVGKVMPHKHCPLFIVPARRSPVTHKQ